MHVMDRLSSLLQHFKIKTNVFSQGKLCGEHAFEIQAGMGHIHIIKKAPLEIILKDKQLIEVTESSVVFFPRPTEHSFRSVTPEGADMVCAKVSIGSGLQNPLILGLPELLVIPTSQLVGFEEIFNLLYQEAFSDRCGRQHAIDHLMDYLTVRMYRFLIQENLIPSSAIAGMADPKISKAIEAMHSHPGQNWNLDQLAQEAGMSRARFADHFKEKVGLAPIAYLTELRINLAIRKLQEGRPIKNLHRELGYASASSFTRVFNQKNGMSPKEWAQCNSLKLSPKPTMLDAP